ncbi:MAG: GNAT family N-acetyltransferase [Flavobacteriales bacterium]|nr:GNAT family N-acetyltransferase [Flavobacteriales bacterium]
MIEYQLLNTTDFVTTLEKEAIINFLMTNLDDYLDSRENVSRAIEYALSKFPHQGGFVIIASIETEIVGVSVVNRTNFEGYFAENILAFLATAEKERRKGIATELLNRSKLYAKGNILVRLTAGKTTHDIFGRAGFLPDAQEFLFKR